MQTSNDNETSEEEEADFELYGNIGLNDYDKNVAFHGKNAYSIKNIFGYFNNNQPIQPNMKQVNSGKEPRKSLLISDKITDDLMY